MSAYQEKYPRFPSLKNEVQVLKFNKENLEKAVSNQLYPSERIRNKPLFKYLVKYLSNPESRNDKLRAATIVIENQYISESYSKDFKFYYIDGHHPPSKFTTRLHFFSNVIDDQEAFYEILINKDQNFWDTHYLGYVIIRPLNTAPFGAVALKHYQSVDTTSITRKRFYSTTIDIHANVFGRELTIKCLPFIEQDGAVGACATSALWSALHRTSRLFGHIKPAPHQITKAAGISFEGFSLFPNIGLDFHQVAQVLDSFDLGFVIRKSMEGRYISNSELKKTAYPYLKMGVPILLGYEILDYDDEVSGFHLVTICGYRMNENKSKISRVDKRINYISDDIKRLFVHNDQFGPYAKMDFEPEFLIELSPFSDDLQEDHNDYMKAFQDDISGQHAKVRVMSLMIPLHKKIKVSEIDVEQSVELFDQVIKDVFQKAILRNPEVEFEDTSLIWDLRLEKSSNYKKKHLDNGEEIEEAPRKEILTSSFPKYIWVASLYYDDLLIIDIIYDASALPYSFCMKAIFIFDKTIETLFLTYSIKLLEDTIQTGSNKFASSNHIEFIRQMLRNK